MEDIIKMVMAEAAKSNVDKRKVGCVIMGENGEILGVGHNLETTVTPYADDATCLVVEHAEEMAINDVSQFMLEGVAGGLFNPTVYVSHSPCKNCSMKLLEKGFKNIIIVEAFMKFDTDKIRYDLIPPRSMELLAEVLTFGAKKYKPNNWRTNTDLTRYEGALLRHIQAWRLGEKNDPETGLPHLAHAMCNLTFLMELDNDK